MSLIFTATLEERGFNVSFEFETGRRVAVLGPNGAGKSTLLQILAGTLLPNEGYCELDGNTLFDLRSKAGSDRRRSARVWVDPRKRRIGLLAQDPALFPHLTAVDNVAFGLRAQGQRRGQSRQSALKWLETTGAKQFANRKPSSLSGGQAQRVAVARALAVDPDLVLLDEPMAPVDASTAPHLRRTLNSVLAHKTTLIVTHDVLDALLLSDHAIVLDRGRVVQSGPTRQVLGHPKTAFTAALAGVNLIGGKWEDGSLNVDDESIRLHALTEQNKPAEGEATAATFSPSSVSVYNKISPGSPRNHFAVRITRLEPSESAVRVYGATPGGTEICALVTPTSVADLALAPGEDVWFAVKATAVTVFPL